MPGIDNRQAVGDYFWMEVRKMDGGSFSLVDKLGMHGMDIWHDRTTSVGSLPLSLFLYSTLRWCGLFKLNSGLQCFFDDLGFV